MSTTKQASEMTAEELLGVASCGGNWRFCNSRNIDGSIFISGDDSRVLVDLSHSGATQLVSEAERVANGELIVRAVGAFGEMREALAVLHDAGMDAFNYMGDALPPTPVDEIVDNLREAMHKARKALARASGKGCGEVVR